MSVSHNILQLSSSQYLDSYNNFPINSAPSKLLVYIMLHNVLNKTQERDNIVKPKIPLM